jgi:hypothetical protein
VDEVTGKIATCVGSNVRVYKPYGLGEDSLKVCFHKTNLKLPEIRLIGISGLYNIASRSRNLLRLYRGE